MPSFAEQHAQWQKAQADAATARTREAAAEAERQRQALINSRAVQAARQRLDARPAGAPLGDRVKARRGRS